MQFIYIEITIIALAALIVCLIKFGPKGPTKAALRHRAELFRTLGENKPMNTITPEERAQKLHQLEQDILKAEKLANQIDEPMLAYTLSMALNEIQNLKKKPTDINE